MVINQTKDLIVIRLIKKIFHQYKKVIDKNELKIYYGLLYSEMSIMGKNIIIAIDGPAASGKSTTAKRLAEELKFLYIDTGAMYRACALYAIEHHTNLKDVSSVEAMLNQIDILFKTIDSKNLIFLNNRDITDLIRTPEVSQKASEIATIANVRHRMVFLQREMAKNSSVIMDGRDIGSFVFPKADFKFFMLATLDARTKRRQIEMQEKGLEVDFEQLREELAWRDANDANRDIAPLIKANDAVEVNTTTMSIEEQVDFILKKIREKIA
ncbi:MAG TPA: (d)CMP kinase [Candidatus Cloacimonadota bacterium]|nr:(d)CMP kinase [Candidatus Cloacimonadota bacterium]HQB41564.1 (d)CMP kinase [Candidatus Cloacimonadota bacterium]